MPFPLTADKIDSDYAVHAVADKRLTVDSEFSRGCGGVAILWRKSLQTLDLARDVDHVFVMQS